MKFWTSDGPKNYNITTLQIRSSHHPLIHPWNLKLHSVNSWYEMINSQNSIIKQHHYTVSKFLCGAWRRGQSSCKLYVAQVDLYCNGVPLDLKYQIAWNALGYLVTIVSKWLVQLIQDWNYHEDSFRATPNFDLIVLSLSLIHRSLKYTRQIGRAHVWTPVTP